MRFALNSAEETMSNSLRTTVLMGAITALFIGLGALLGGQTGMLAALLIAWLTNFAGYWFSDKFVVAMHGARQVVPSGSPMLTEIVSRLSRAAAIPAPRVYLINSNTPNAFATGRNPQNATIAVTCGLIHLSSTSEIEAVIAHEISHIRRPICRAFIHREPLQRERADPTIFHSSTNRGAHEPSVADGSPEAKRMGKGVFYC
jgi:Zn-dependent protease with chaperone function